MKTDTANTLSVAQFCQRTGLSKSTAYEELRSQRLKSFLVGRRRLITLAAFDAWQNAREAASAPKLRPVRSRSHRAAITTTTASGGGTSGARHHAAPV